MKRVLFFIATVGLTAGLFGSYEQKRAAADTAKSREEWQSRVNATLVNGWNGGVKKLGASAKSGSVQNESN
jgi:hypothetical protein